MSKKVQEEVYQLVAVDRGYHEGYTSEQFAARQVAKLVEEVAELAMEVQQIENSRVLVTWENRIREAGKLARRYFDWGMWKSSRVIDPKAALDELADIQVIVYCMSEALNRMLGQEIDISQRALDKARSDVERGVRRDG